MRHRAVEVIAHERAARTPLGPIRAEHEVVNEQLAARAEKIGERDLSPRRVEDIIRLDFDPRQLTPLSRQLVALAGVLYSLSPEAPCALRPIFPSKRLAV